jgi:hypothetical protein
VITLSTGAATGGHPSGTQPRRLQSSRRLRAESIDPHAENVRIRTHQHALITQELLIFGRQGVEDLVVEYEHAQGIELHVKLALFIDDTLLVGR